MTTKEIDPEVWEHLDTYLEESRQSWLNLSIKTQVEIEQRRQKEQASRYYRDEQEAIKKGTWQCEHCAQDVLPRLIDGLNQYRKVVSIQKYCTCLGARVQQKADNDKAYEDERQTYTDWLITSKKWQEFNINWPNTQEAKDQLNEAKELVLNMYLDNRSGILLAGPVGCGKSHLARALHGAWGNQGKRVKFFTEPEIVGALTSGNDDARCITQNCKAADILILDDIGAETFNHQSEWVKNKLQSFYFTVFESRKALGKKTVITTNLTNSKPEQEFLNHAGPRANSRIGHILNIGVGFENIVSLWDVPDYRASGLDSDVLDVENYDLSGF